MKNAKTKGSIYIWMLFIVTISGILMAETGQVWLVKSQREKEKELLLIGEQFRQAVISYYNSADVAEKKYPKNLDDLLEDKRGPKPQRHLRKIFIDPMTKETEWGLVEEPLPDPGAGISISRSDLGIIGVYSLSKQAPIKTENFPEHYSNFAEASTYQDWQFVFTQDSESTEEGAATQNAPSQTNANSPFSPQGGQPSTPNNPVTAPQGTVRQNQQPQKQPSGSLFQ